MVVNQNMATYWECSIVKSIVLVSLEEVSIPVCVLQGGIDVVGNAFPVGYWFRVGGFHWRSLQWVKPPEFATLEEVDFSIAAPHHSSIKIVWNAGETIGDLLWIVTIDCASWISPVPVTLEKVCLAVFVCESGINVGWKITFRLFDFPSSLSS